MRDLLGFEHAIDEALREEPVFIADTVRPGIQILALKLVIDHFLLSLDVSKHVRAFWQRDEVWEYLRVLVVKLAKPGQPDQGLLPGITSLKEFIDIVVNKVVFENTHDVGLFVVDEVVHDFDVVVFALHVAVLRCQPGCR